jgi:ElaB/YqjD/DUF883 family membrane-anchored ribosome-binding protein
MTTQSSVYPEVNVPPTRKPATDGRSTPEATENVGPDMKTRLRQMVESGKDRATEWKDGFQDGIRERPIQSVLIAAAVGAVVGVILGRRTR